MIFLRNASYDLIYSTPGSYHRCGYGTKRFGTQRWQDEATEPHSLKDGAIFGLECRVCWHASAFSSSRNITTGRRRSYIGRVGTYLKRRKYSTLDNGYLFVPFGDTLGQWGPGANAFFLNNSGFI